MLNICNLCYLCFIEFIMVDDIFHKFCVLWSRWIQNSKCNSWCTKSTTSANSMEIGGSTGFHLPFNLIAWNIVIDNKFSFWDINTSRNQIGTYQSMYGLISEIFHSLISRFFCQSRVHNMGT
jgi:hypothetical protein